MTAKAAKAEFTVSDFLYDHCMTIESGHSNLAPCRRACH